MKGILFFDVDGTLIDSGHGREVPDEKVMEAIGRLRRRGYACIVSSGRNMSGLHMLKGIGFDGFVFGNFTLTLFVILYIFLSNWSNLEFMQS